AGAIGGLMGGAMAAADNHRSPGGPRHPAPPEELEDEDDEFLRFLDEEPTYLEPADEVNALIGRMEPTSPAVLGAWTERERTGMSPRTRSRWPGPAPTATAPRTPPPFAPPPAVPPNPPAR